MPKTMEVSSKANHDFFENNRICMQKTGFYAFITKFILFFNLLSSKKILAPNRKGREISSQQYEL